MRRRPRLTEAERLSIANERAEGVPLQLLADRYGVSRMSIYNVLNRDLGQQVGDRPSSRIIGVRLSERELTGFDAALARRGITHRPDAMRCLMQAADKLLQPDGAMNDRLGEMNAELKRVGSNVNLIARALNEARLRGEPAAFTEDSQGTMRELVGLVLGMAGEIQVMWSARLDTLGQEVDRALASLASGDVGGWGTVQGEAGEQGEAGCESRCVHLAPR